MELRGSYLLDSLNNRVESIQQYDISTDAMCMDIIRCHNKYLVAAKHAKQTKDDLVKKSRGGHSCKTTRLWEKD